MNPLPIDLERLQTYSNLNKEPTLYVLATPLGNLGDISLRALAVLNQVECIAAEDTRHSQKLLDAYGIKTRLFAAHQHNEQHAAEQLISYLQAGQQIALISDAGTPAISDPGAQIVRAVQDAGFIVSPIPGACAAVSALSVSGLTGAFRFVGFLPPKVQARAQVLAQLAYVDAHLVFYEAPHRIQECVVELVTQFGAQREVVFCRELTKRFEQIVRMPLEQAPQWLAEDENRQRGEFVLIVSAAKSSDDEFMQEIPLRATEILTHLLAELPLKQAASLAAQITGLSRKKLYEYALSLKQD